MDTKPNPQGEITQNETKQDLGPAFFRVLPRELRDQIYRLAFVEDETSTCTIISLEKWMEDERRRRRYHSRRFRDSPYRPTELASKPIPTCPLLGMIVNKQFYDEAATSWLRYRALKCKDMYTFNDLCKASSQLRKNLTKFNCEWSINSHFFFEGLATCKSLRELRISVHDQAFDCFDNRLVCFHALTDKDFSSMQSVKDLMRMPSLELVELKAHPSDLATTDAEREQWGKNVATFESYINALLKKREAQKSKATPSKSPKSDLNDMEMEPFDALAAEEQLMASLGLPSRRSLGLTSRGRIVSSRPGSKPLGITKRPKKLTLGSNPRSLGFGGLSRKHIAMTAAIASVVSGVVSVGVVKLLI